jgi:hypothetical protein
MAQPMASTSLSIRFNRRRMPNMVNLAKTPITRNEVIKYLDEVLELERITDSLVEIPDRGTPLALTVIAVIKAASTIVQNDIGSEAAQLLEKAFNSQNLPIKEIA